MTWVGVKPIKGGQLVYCRLCGTRVLRSTFRAAETNYAEALRLATARAWEHEHSDEHAAALNAFHAKEPPPPTSADLVERLFGEPGPSEAELRRRAARAAAEAQVRANVTATRRDAVVTSPSSVKYPVAESGGRLSPSHRA